jgi:protein-L-isoaspartate(D-aspartate) O-methyltransferase
MFKILKRFPCQVIVIMLMLAGTSCKTEQSKEKTDFAQARRQMVDSQIRARGISDQRVIQAMNKVERHLFVPESYRDLAYTDQPLPIGEDQTISQPYIVAIMTELLHLNGDEKVLEIGTGSGYQAAILAEMANQVYTIEIVEPLATQADKLLKQLGYKNITVKCGDGYIGWEEHAPFDAIIVTCAPPEVPQPLVEQLADGGRMVVPVGTSWQELLLIEKKDSTITETSVLPVRFVPMIGEGVKKRQ